MADGSNHIDEYEELQDEHDALSLKPSERARFEERLKRSAKTMQLQGHLQAFAKLRPDDRALLERAVTYWGKVLDKDRRGEGVDPLVKRVWEGGQRKAAKKAQRARFATAAIDPQRVTGIDEWHSAAEDGRTIFPKSVTAAWDTDRLLVSGHNNAKLGRAAEKGEWAGMPIFHLTLEERATCPRTCEQWLTCLTPDARVLTADLRWQPIGELIVGQRIVGFDEHPVGVGRWVKVGNHWFEATADQPIMVELTPLDKSNIANMANDAMRYAIFSHDDLHDREQREAWMSEGASDARRHRSRCDCEGDLEGRHLSHCAVYKTGASEP